MDAVVMAAGEARRLRPLTERWAKAVLPIDGRPVVASVLHELAEAELRDVWLVVGHLGGQLERLVGDGSAFGLRVRYVRQAEPLGSADAVAAALAAGARPPCIVVGADTVFPPGTVARARDEWVASGTSGGLAVREVPEDELEERSLVRADGGRLLSVVEKPPPGTPDGRLAGAPLWFLDAELAELLVDLPGPPFELATAVEHALARSRALAAIRIGRTRDITWPRDVVRRNFPYLSGLEGE